MSWGWFHVAWPHTLHTHIHTLTELKEGLPLDPWLGSHIWLEVVCVCLWLCIQVYLCVYIQTRTHTLRLVGHVSHEQCPWVSSRSLSVCHILQLEWWMLNFLTRVSLPSETWGVVESNHSSLRYRLAFSMFDHFQPCSFNTPSKWEVIQLWFSQKVPPFFTAALLYTYVFFLGAFLSIVFSCPFHFFHMTFL